MLHVLRPLDDYLQRLEVGGGSEQWQLPLRPLPAWGRQPDAVARRGRAAADATLPRLLAVLPGSTTACWHHTSRPPACCGASQAAQGSGGPAPSDQLAEEARVALLLLGDAIYAELVGGRARLRRPGWARPGCLVVPAPQANHACLGPAAGRVGRA